MVYVKVIIVIAILIITEPLGAPLLPGLLFRLGGGRGLGHRLLGDGRLGRPEYVLSSDLRNFGLYT